MILSKAAVSYQSPNKNTTGKSLYLDEDDLRRLCISLICSEQDRLLRSGGIIACKTDVLKNRKLSDTEVDSLRIDLQTLGFDSLSLLELVMRFNLFLGLHETGIEDYLLVERKVGDWVTLLSEHFKNAPADLKLTFQTSGSSGAPKNITHRLDRLYLEVRSVLNGPLDLLRPDSRIVTLVPPYHIYGFLFTVLLPSVNRHKVVDISHLGPGAALRVARPGDLVIGTPLNWLYISKLSKFFKDEVHGVVSAGPTSKEMWNVLNNNKLSSMTEVYGATETLGVATRKSHDQPFVLMPHLHRLNESIADAEGVLPLQDKLIWQDSNTFVLNGRIDDMVQVAGVNVSKTLIREKCLSEPGVADVVIRCENNHLKAFVQTELTGKDLENLAFRVRLSVEQHFTSAAVPRSIVFGTSLPRNAMGKLCDWKCEDHENGFTSSSKIKAYLSE